jgi:peptidoglycan hydrolase-like protein with peptidoglycan-binding domain
MKKFLAIAVVLAFSITMFGCGKKQEASQEPMTMEALNTINAPAATAPETKAEQQVAPSPAQPAAPAAQAKVETALTPPQGPYKPSAIEIQTALKNAGFYTGKVDGKIGPMSKKAIEAFQKANGLTADGKVGPKTWVALSKFLNAAATGAEQKQ